MAVTGSHVYLVASSTASATVKARADSLCDGIDDEAEINAAVLVGSVQLTDGDYTIGSPILMTKPGGSLRGTGHGEDMVGNGGRGWGTLILTKVGFVGTEAIRVSQAARPAGQVTLSDFKIDGVEATQTTPNIDGIVVRSYQFYLRTSTSAR